MAIRGPSLGPSGTSKTDTPPTSVYDIVDNASSTLLTSSSMAGSTSAVVIRQLAAGGTSTGLGNTAAANTSLANNIGWWIPPTAGMAVTGSDLRVMPAGSTITFKGTIVGTGSGNDTMTFTVYRRSSAGALTSLGSASFTAANGLTGTTTLGTATFTFASETTFATGETIYVEVYVSIPSNGLGANNVVAKLGSATMAWTFNTPNGILYRYPRSQSVIGTAVIATRKALTVGAKAAVGAGVASYSRGALSLPRAFAVSASGTTSLVRQVGVVRRAVGTGAAVLGQRSLALAAKVAVGTGAVSTLKAITVGAKIATGSGVATARRSVTAFRSFAVASTGSAVFARSVITARTFLVAATGVAGARLDIPQAVLNRITGAGAAVRKVKVFLFDD